MNEEAYTEGYRAYLNGEDEMSNPYPTGYDDAPGEHWLDGYEDAREDHEE